MFTKLKTSFEQTHAIQVFIWNISLYLIYLFFVALKQSDLQYKKNISLMEVGAYSYNNHLLYGNRSVTLQFYKKKLTRA